jgi:hypothetical protein
MSGRDDLLFYQYDLGATLRNNLEVSKNDVEAIPADQFNISDDEALVEHVYSKREVFPLELHVDAMEVDQKETQVDVRHDFNRAIFDKSRPCMIPGLRLTVSIPFTGEAELWKCKPSTSTMNPPRAVVHSSDRGSDSGHIDIVLTRPSDTLGDGQALRGEIDKTIESIQQYLGWSRSNIESHNRELKQHIQRCVVDRRARLGSHKQVLSALNIPMKKKPGAPDITPIPLPKVREIKPLPSRKHQKPEYGISNLDYDYTLKLIRHSGRTYEAAPDTYAMHDEEGLRDIILSMLNGYYQGAATGETFRKSGKTDIRIEYESRTAFVAECKLWKGAKELTEAIDQLLGYLVWRDCKAALIVFNKSVAGFSAIQQKLPEVIKEHPMFIRQKEATEHSEWRFVIRSAEDDERHITLHVFLFNLYIKK